ncbi:MAG: hypothetical protein AABW41_04715 [Nanoarchaeota archaeon]
MEIKNAKLFAKGKRSYIYVKKIENKIIAYKVAIDIKRTMNVIKNETRFLKMLNKYKIGPKLIDHNKSYVAYEFVSGMPILEWAKKANKLGIIKVLKNLMKQCFVMDKLGINKKELHHPIKHIIIKDELPVMIDFERCYYTKNPKNLSQFSQFLIYGKFSGVLKEKNIRLDEKKFMGNIKKYKKNLNLGSFLEVINSLG